MVDTDDRLIGIDLEQEFHRLSVSEVYTALRTESQGLTASEAVARLKYYGPNAIQKIKGKPLILRFLKNFTHLMAILLWFGGIVGFIAQMPQLGFAIWMVNIINGIFSFWQEFRAERAIEELLKLLPTYARVMRDGYEHRILTEDLVPGDIVLLAEGDQISADCRLVDDSELRIDQSTLTGESHAVRKTKEAALQTDLAKAEQVNLIFAGTNVASGTAKAVVVSTGMKTEFGKIAKITQNLKDAPSPLQKELGRLTRIVSIMAVSIGVLFFILAVFIANADLAESFIFSMGMIVAFVPEGLLPTVTLSLAMGVQRMVKRNALIKRLSAVETLGCTTVICTDKTGTLTQNEMTVSDLWLVDQPFKVTGVGYASDGQIFRDNQPVSLAENDDLRQLLIAAGLCNNSRLVPPKDSSARWTVLGDPTEAAMLVVAQKGGLILDLEERQTPRLREIPFDSRRKRMSTIHQINDPASIQIAYVKGSPKEVLDLCICVRQEGQDIPMSETQRAQIMSANDSYARNGLRVLAVAQRNLTKDALLPESLSDYTPELIEQNLTFLGLISMADPPRPEVTEAVEKCHHAGIRIIMITGDYGLTAESIARRIGIIQSDHPRIITGIELEQMEQDTLKEALRNEILFARVAPEQKLRVVSALQEIGHVVAVTGDGVNDAPALKKSDIGVAMGIAGTDVAKEAADMILIDDNFASIVNAVEEGRAVYNNIRKFSIYILNSNVPEAVPFIFYLFSKGTIPLPLTVMQVLAIDLGTDMVPAIGLGAELPEPGIMNNPPRSQKEPLLSRRLLLRAFFWYGLIESTAAIVSFYFLNRMHGWPDVPMATSGVDYRMATTMTLAAIVVCQVGVVFNCRTNRASIFKTGFLTNRFILIGIVFELSLLCLLIYAPFLNTLFNTAPINLQEWAFLFIWAPVIFFIDELRKLILRRLEKRTIKKRAKKR